MLTLPASYLFAANTEQSSTIVRFCAPHNNVYPFFVTDNGNLSGINADMLQQLFNKRSLSDVTLSFVRRPWKRCNSDLENGEVDMMIGGYDAKRNNVVYPSELGFALGDTAISTAEVCFSSIPGEQMENARRGLRGESSFIVGIEAGFSKQHSSAIKPQWVVLFNPIEKFRMLEMGRVDAIVQVCSMDGEHPIKTEAEAIGFNDFKTLYPPYLSNPAYAVFSEKFAKAHRDVAVRIVTESQNLDKGIIFSQYRPGIL